MAAPAASDFNHLTPDTVLNIVEETTGARCTNLCRSLNSYINRVYEVQQADGTFLIAKFYRPGRWSPEALRDEQDFLLELEEAEIPVVAPLRDPAGQTLHHALDTWFALFPKKGGRICDEPSAEQWGQLGRLLARVHVVGSRKTPRDRIRMLPGESSRQQVDYILQSGLGTAAWRAAYEAAARETLELIAPLFEDHELIRIHGDCHHQNIIFRPGEGFYIIDFDDMAMGLPVQDLWMLLPGRVQDSQKELGWLLDGYELFREFDHASLRLVEPLRAMRYIHYTAWCVRQAADGGFARLSPDWGSEAYWRQQIHELKQQQQEIRDALD
jgi:Ser/Thr protein kinase RdoA (MazF antagonist)